MKTSFALIVLISSAAIGMTGCMNRDGGRHSGSSSTAESTTGSGYGARAGQGIDNSVLTSRVKTALAAHSSLKTLILNVDSDNGAVTISGTVTSREAFDSVTRVVRDVDGVKSVNNRLVIRADN